MLADFLMLESSRVSTLYFTSFRMSLSLSHFFLGLRSIRAILYSIIIVMNSLKHNLVKSSSRQKEKTKNNNQPKEVFLRFTLFQVIVVALQLASIFITTLFFNWFTLGYFFAFLLAPIFIGSILIEIVFLTIIAISHRISKTKAQKPSNVSNHRKNKNKNNNTNTSNQTKRLDPSVKALITLILMLSFVMLLYYGYIVSPKKYAISDAFSKEEKALNVSLYHTKIVEKDVSSGIMTIQLDNDITFNYECKVYPFGIDTGYGPYCNYHFSDGSHSIGEYIFNRNNDDFRSLLTKYQDTLTVDNADYIFKVINQDKMESFFTELMQNADYNKAFKSFKALKDSSDQVGLSSNLDYLFIRQVKYQNFTNASVGLFSWAVDRGLEP